MAQPAQRQATYADLEAVPDHLVAEIINGTLETYRRSHHLMFAAELASKLVPRFEDARAEPSGWTFMVEPKLFLGRGVIVPDLAGWRRSRMPMGPEAAFIETPPDWVCEILSPATARIDRVPKRRIYAKAAVRHLWLLDPTNELLEAFELAGSHCLLLATVLRGEAVALPPFDAVSFPLDDLFAFDDPAAPAQPET